MLSNIFSWYFKSNLLLRILIALILGSILGMLLPQQSIIYGDTLTVDFLKPFGDLFVRLLKMVMVPVIICSLIVGSSSIPPSQLGKVGVKTLVFYAITSIFAVSIGLVSGYIFEPGSGLTLDSTVQAVSKEAHAPSLSSILLNIVPTNPFESIFQGNILAIICFCLFVGISLAFCRDSKEEHVKNAGDTVFAFFEGICEIMFNIIRWVMQYAPIGVFALMFIVFNKNGAAAFGSLATVTLSVYVGLAVQIFVVYCAICLFLKLKPLAFLQRVRKPMVTAFVTRSSSATVPISMETAEKDMGVPRGISGFVLPVGATINMDGTTIYLGVCTMFIANAIGMDLTAAHYFTILITSVLAAIGTAGVPGAGALMLLLILESVGLKVEGSVAIAYAMILGIDALLDMGRTSMNVVGDMIAAIWVAKKENRLDMSKWDGSAVHKKS